MSARDQGPAGAPRRRCPGHAPASFSFPRSLSVSQTHGQMSARDQGPAGAPRRRCPGHHGYSSWPPFTASSSNSSGRRRWPLCLEPLHPLHRAGALARAQAPGRRPRVSLPDLDLAGRRSHDKADPAASRGQPRGARALREQRRRSSCSFAMAASMSRPAASLPRRRARRRRAAAPPWQHGARRRSPPHRQTSPPSGTG